MLLVVCSEILLMRRIGCYLCMEASPAYVRNRILVMVGIEMLLMRRVGFRLWGLGVCIYMVLYGVLHGVCILLMVPQ